MHAWFMIKNANAKDIALFPQQNAVTNTLNISGIRQWELYTRIK
jgi:hypothetical protein